MTIEAPTPLATYRHVKTGGLYVVLTIATCATTGHEYVVYQSTPDSLKPWCRRLEGTPDAWCTHLPDGSPRFARVY